MGSARLALAASLVLAWFAACGGETGKRAALESSGAGEAGSVDVFAGGAGAQECIAGDGGHLIHGGDAALLEGGSSARAGAPSSEGGGAGGATLGGATALGGEPSAPAAGAAGAVNAAGAAGDAGASGAAGAPAQCCQPLKCADVIPGLDCATNYFRDGCGSAFFCGCPAGDECSQNQCVVCDPGADPCAADADLCGATKDRCGNAVNCADNCQSLLGPLGTCDDGRCCQLTKTTCAADDCGFMSDGCGGFVDCTGNVCQAGACQLDGKCCTPSVACLPEDCGFKSDGCGNYLDCGDACTGDTLCMENRCRDSVCKLGGFECETAYNQAVDGYEYCGSCPRGQGCLRHHCLPLCSQATP
ncbi:MAG TPA: hypothetical protein VNG33_09480 [Polyangiaceae bacterium]|nr:hypothetical protein [Polyangiaceae bacterium]